MTNWELETSFCGVRYRFAIVLSPAIDRQRQTLKSHQYSKKTKQRKKTYQGSRCIASQAPASAATAVSAAAVAVAAVADGGDDVGRCSLFKYLLVQ